MRNITRLVRLSASVDGVRSHVPPIVRALTMPRHVYPGLKRALETLTKSYLIEKKLRWLYRTESVVVSLAVTGKSTVQRSKTWPIEGRAGPFKYGIQLSHVTTVAQQLPTLIPSTLKCPGELLLSASAFA